MNALTTAILVALGPLTSDKTKTCHLCVGCLVDVPLAAQVVLRAEGPLLVGRLKKHDDGVRLEGMVLAGNVRDAAPV